MSYYHILCILLLHHFLRGYYNIWLVYELQLCSKLLIPCKYFLCFKKIRNNKTLEHTITSTTTQTGIRPKWLVPVAFSPGTNG
jgi:hypothetical protein